MKRMYGLVPGVLLLVAAALSAAPRQQIESRVVLNEQLPGERIREYSRFAFRLDDNPWSPLQELYVQRQLAALLENKGYHRDQESPEFVISVNWTVDPLEPFLDGEQYVLAADYSPHGHFTRYDDPPDVYYVHELTLAVEEVATRSRMWTYTGRTHSAGTDIRATSIYLLKDAVAYLPTHEPGPPRPGQLLPPDRFRAYAKKYAFNRDFALPGLRAAVSLMPISERGEFDVNGLLANLPAPELLPLFIDLLEYGVLYRIDGETVELAGKYAADGRTLHLVAAATWNGNRYIVDRMDSVGELAFADVQQAMFAATGERERRFLLYASQPPLPEEVVEILPLFLPDLELRKQRAGSEVLPFFLPDLELREQLREERKKQARETGKQLTPWYPPPGEDEEDGS